MQNAATPSTSKISGFFTKATTQKRTFYIKDIRMLEIDSEDASVFHLGFVATAGGRELEEYSFEAESSLKCQEMYSKIQHCRKLR